MNPITPGSDGRTILDKYSKVYIRQKHPLFKARHLQIEENHPQLQEGDNDSAAQPINQHKAKNQSNVEAERRLKSKIECSIEVLKPNRNSATALSLCLVLLVFYCNCFAFSL